MLINILEIGLLGLIPFLEFLLILLFALAAPVGFLLGKYTLISEYANPISAIVCGIFLHISTVILFEANAGHKFNFQKFLVMILGFLIAYFSISFAHHSH